MTSDPQWRDALLAALRDDTGWEHALATLRAIDPAESAERIDARLAGALVLLLGDPSRTRQRHAADALRRLVAHAPELAAALHAALRALDPRLRWGAAYTLGHADGPPGAELWPAVRETLALEDGDQRWAAAELTCDLARHHRRVLDDVRSTAESGSPTMRRMLLYCLRDLADPEMGRVALGRLDDEDAGVRLAALAALATVPAAAPPLAERIARLVEADPDPGVRRAAAATLGRLGLASDGVLAALRQAAEGPDPSLARAAKGALGRLC